MADERWRAHKYKLCAPKSGHVHWVLQYKRKRANGVYGDWENFTLKKGVPPWIFKWLLKKVRDLYKNLHSGGKTYHKELPKIIDTLIRNGVAQGFKAKATDKDYGDVTWYCQGEPLAVFMIADLGNGKQIWGNPFDAAQVLRDDHKNPEGHRFRKMESKTKAPVRLVWTVSLTGKWFRLGIGKMRKREKKSHG